MKRMVYLACLVFLWGVLAACETAVPATTPAPPIGDNRPPATAPPLVAVARPTTTSTDERLTQMAEALLTLQSAQWTTRIAGVDASGDAPILVEETETTCTVLLPNDSYCATNFLARLGGTPSTVPLELRQVGPQQWARQGSLEWRPLRSASAPDSIILHDLLRLRGGQLRFFARDFVTSVTVVGRETLNGVETDILSLTFEVDAAELASQWYGGNTPRPQPDQQSFTSRLWLGREDQLPYRSESELRTVSGEAVSLLTFETDYGPFDAVVTLPQP